MPGFAPRAGSGMVGDAGMAGAHPEPIEDAGQVSNPLLDAWLQEHGTCQYVHTFDDQGVYTISSTTGEHIKASYRVEAPAEPGGRFSLHFVVSADNNVVDCEGDMIDADHVDIYLSPTDGAVFIALTRT